MRALTTASCKPSREYAVKWDRRCKRTACTVEKFLTKGVCSANVLLLLARYQCPVAVPLALAASMMLSSADLRAQRENKGKELTDLI